jgi:hypothetical protein
MEQRGTAEGDGVELQLHRLGRNPRNGSSSPSRRRSETTPWCFGWPRTCVWESEASGRVVLRLGCAFEQPRWWCTVAWARLEFHACTKVIEQKSDVNVQGMECRAQ